MEELYINKKKDYLLNAKKLREKINELSFKVANFGNKGINLFKLAQNDLKLVFDFAQMCELDEDIIFMVRAMAYDVYSRSY